MGVSNPVSAFAAGMVFPSGLDDGSLVPPQHGAWEASSSSSSLLPTHQPVPVCNCAQFFQCPFFRGFLKVAHPARLAVPQFRASLLPAARIPPSVAVCLAYPKDSSCLCSSKGIGIPNHSTPWLSLLPGAGECMALAPSTCSRATRFWSPQAWFR